MKIPVAPTKEYIMAQYGLADVNSVAGYMIKTLKFFCGLMKYDVGERDEKIEKA